MGLKQRKRIIRKENGLKLSTVELKNGENNELNPIKEQENIINQ